MVLFDLTVEKQNIHGADKVSLAASANKTIGLRFHFDRHWRDFSSKAAIFKNHSGEFYIIEIKNNIAVIPWEVLKEAYDVELSLIAYYTSMVLSTGVVSLPVSRSLLPEEYALKSASETLFAKFKQECTAQAFLDYEDEIAAQKTTYENALLQKQNQIASEQQSKAAAIAAKNAEIASINLQHSEEKTALQAQLASSQAQLAAMTIKANKWDMVDNAIKKKTASNQPLWGYSTEKYSLPDMNTSAVTSFTYSNIGGLLEEVGFDTASATSLASLFQNHSSIKKIRFFNTENISNLAYTINNCRVLEDIVIGDIPKCTTMSRFATGCGFLKKIKIGTNKLLQVFDYAFQNCNILEEIDTVFDMTNCSTFTASFDNCVSLKKIRFKENSISTTISFGSSINLTKESLQSIINGLNPNVTSKSLTLSRYCFSQAFPTEEEQEEMYDLVTETKGWIFNLA